MPTFSYHHDGGLCGTPGMSPRGSARQALDAGAGAGPEKEEEAEDAPAEASALVAKVKEKADPFYDR
jgi:hypothetical protein